MTNASLITLSVRPAHCFRHLQDLLPQMGFEVRSVNAVFHALQCRQQRGVRRLRVRYLISLYGRHDHTDVHVCISPGMINNLLASSYDADVIDGLLAALAQVYADGQPGVPAEAGT